MLQTFTNLGIGTRLYAGFGLVLLLNALLAVLSGFETSHLRNNFDAYANMAGDALLVSEIDGDMSDLRLGVNRYMLSNSDTDKEQAAKSYEQVQQGMKLAKKDIQNPRRAELISEIDAHSVAYQKGFEQITDLIHRRNAVVDDQLDQLGPYIREKLTGLNETLTRQGDHQTANLAGIVQEDFLSARLFVIKFLDTNDISAIDRARTEFTEVEAALEHLKLVIDEEHMPVVADIEKNLPKYE